MVVKHPAHFWWLQLMFARELSVRVPEVDFLGVHPGELHISANQGCKDVLMARDKDRQCMTASERVGNSMCRPAMIIA
eukprot:scaffold108527_cov15-Tisochrysis_lutea.AAC.1